MIDADQARTERARREEQIALAEAWIARPECTPDERDAALVTVENHRRALAALPEIVEW